MRNGKWSIYEERDAFILPPCPFWWDTCGSTWVFWWSYFDWLAYTHAHHLYHGPPIIPLWSVDTLMVNWSNSHRWVITLVFTSNDLNFFHIFSLFYFINLILFFVFLLLMGLQANGHVPFLLASPICLSLIKSNKFYTPFVCIILFVIC